MTVYVIQETAGRNVLSAQEFGQLEVLLPPNANIVLSPGPTIRMVNRSLRKFSDKDYLLLMGDPAAIGIACAVAARANNGRFKLLKWDRLTSQYFPIEVDTNNSKPTWQEEIIDMAEEDGAVASKPTVPVIIKRKKGERNVD